MNCNHCGMENFEVSVTCVRCKQPLKANVPHTKNPLFRSNPDPEPPTQISGVGLERVRFGPAPEMQQEAPQKMRSPRPTYQESVAAQPQSSSSPQNSIEQKDSPIQSAPQNEFMEPPPPVHREEAVQEEEAPIPKVLIGFLVLLLGGVFLFLCVDMYALFCLVRA